MVTNCLICLILYVTIQSVGVQQKVGAFTDSIEPGTQAYTLQEQPPHCDRHHTARMCILMQFLLHTQTRQHSAYF